MIRMALNVPSVSKRTLSQISAACRCGPAMGSVVPPSLSAAITVHHADSRWTKTAYRCQAPSPWGDATGLHALAPVTEGYEGMTIDQTISLWAAVGNGIA